MIIYARCLFQEILGQVYNLQKLRFILTENEPSEDPGGSLFSVFETSNNGCVGCRSNNRPSRFYHKIFTG